MTRPTSIAELISKRATIPELFPLLERIKAVYNPLEVLLFGSRARGGATEDSDWDVVVVLPDDADEALLHPLLGWRTQMGSGVYANVLCAYESELLADLVVPNSQARELADHAVILTAGRLSGNRVGDDPARHGMRAQWQGVARLMGRGRPFGARVAMRGAWSAPSASAPARTTGTAPRSGRSPAPRPPPSPPQLACSRR